MATKINIKQLNWTSICLQKKVILIHYLTGLKHFELATAIGVSNSYISEVLHLGRKYNPKYSFLNSLCSTFSINRTWLTDPGILPSEITGYCQDFLNTYVNEELNNELKVRLNEFLETESEMKKMFNDGGKISDDQVKALEKFFDPVKMIIKHK